MDNKNVNDNIMTIVDENGEEKEIEIIATFAVNDTEYAVLMAHDGSDEGVLFRMEQENEEGLVSFTVVEDEEEFEMANAVYMELEDEE